MSASETPPDTTPRKRAELNTLLTGSSLLYGSVAQPAAADVDRWMVRYQQADPEAPGALIVALSPGLREFFRDQKAMREQADDLLEQTWLRIHQLRHTYRPGEPVLPWVYAIARRVAIDACRRARRISSQQRATEQAAQAKTRRLLRDSDTLVAGLPDSQREVLSMMKAAGLRWEEVARATSSTVRAVKRKAHRACEKLLQIYSAEERKRGFDKLQ